MATPNVQISDGLKNKILGVESVRDILRGGRIDCWTGAAPVDANAAATGANVLTITRNSLAS